MNTEGARIPAAALSSKDASLLLDMVDQPTPVVFKFEMDCGFREGRVTTYNVIGELWGEKDEIITWGGHLDGWDLGEGARRWGRCHSQFGGHAPAQISQVPTAAHPALCALHE